MSYAWSFGDGATSTAASPKHVYTNAGTYTAKLVVTDNEGASSTNSASARIIVSAANIPPTANAGPDQTVDERSIVTLDGSASTDDGPISYIWTQVSGEPVDLSPKGALASFTAPRVGLGGKSLRFRLTVIDSNNARADDEVTITVRNSAALNDPPTANAGSGQLVTQGAQVTLDGSNSSDADGENTIVSYDWSQSPQDEVRVSLVNDPATPTATFTAPTVANDAAYVLNFQLVVTDDEGAVSKPANVVVNVTLGEGKLRPVADAGPDQTVGPGALVQLDGSASLDPDGATGSLTDISTFLWESAVPGVVFSNPSIVNPTFSVPAGLPVGSQLEVTLTVTDVDGFVGTDTVVISVGENPPTVDAGEPQTVEEGSTVTLKGTANDNTGIASKLWKQVEGPDVALSDPSNENGETTFVTPIVNGGPEVLLRFEFQATDSDHLSSTDSVDILVKDNGITGIDPGYLPVAGKPFSPGGGNPDDIAPIGFKPLPLDQGSIVLLQSKDPGTVGIKQGLPRRMPYGLFDLHIKTAEPGGTVTLNIQLSSPAPMEPSEFVWFKYNEETGWYPYKGAQISSDRSFVTLTLKDGDPEQGDSDGEEDGIIRDPSGLGQVSEAVLFSGNSGGGGGGTGIWVLFGLGMLIRLRKVGL